MRRAFAASAVLLSLWLLAIAFVASGAQARPAARLSARARKTRPRPCASGGFRTWRAAPAFASG